MAKRAKGAKGKSKFTVKETKLATTFGVHLGIISVCTVLVLVYMTFIHGGEASVSYAFAGFLASLFAVTGLILSILCIIDHYQPHLMGWIGLVTNSIAVLSMAGILYLGML
ncbi:MAG: hypothetical protein J6A45_00285 [Lachnospiraceae bacterium]|nr:hypothetical protein [Lachnospiraceae bacterium]